MKKYFYTILILSSCHNDTSKIDKLEQKIDSLNSKIEKMHHDKDAKDNSSQFLKNDSTSIVLSKKNVAKPSSPVAMTKQISAGKESDTVFYYYTGSKKRSVAIPPMKNEKRNIYFYDTFGNITFNAEEIQLSYTERVECKSFYSNGAVEKIIVHFNPGASRYWSESVIYFGNDNVPQWKETRQLPQETIESGAKKYFWNKEKNDWVQQEVVEEQPFKKF